MLILDAISGSSNLVATFAATGGTGLNLESRTIDSRVWGSSLLLSKGTPATVNTIPRWSNVTAGASALVDSQVTDNGVCVAVGTSAVASDTGSGVELAPALWSVPPSAATGRWSYLGGLITGLPSFATSQATWGHSANILAKWKARGGLLTVTSNTTGVTLYDPDAPINGSDGISGVPETQAQAGGFSVVSSSVAAAGVIITYDFDTYLAGTAYKRLHYRPTALENFRPAVVWNPTGTGVPTNIKVTVSYSADGSATNSTVFTDVIVFNGTPQFKGQSLWVGPNSVVGYASTAWIRRVRFEFTLPTTTTSGDQGRIQFIGLLSNMPQSLDSPSIIARNRWNADQIFTNSNGLRFEPSGSTGPWDAKLSVFSSGNDLVLASQHSGGRVMFGWDKSGSFNYFLAAFYDTTAGIHKFRPNWSAENVQLGDTSRRWSGLYSKDVLDVSRSVGAVFLSGSTTLGGFPVVKVYDAGISFGSGTLDVDVSLFRLAAGALKTDGSFEAVGLVKGATLQSTVATGTAPLVVASTTLVSNLNADKLDGNDGSYFENRDVTAVLSGPAGIVLTRANGSLIAPIDDSLNFPNVEGNVSSSILGAFLNNALVNCATQQGATITSSSTGGVTVTSAAAALTPGSPGYREFCLVQAASGGTATVQITGLTLQTAASGYWESFVILRYPVYSGYISNVLIEVRDSTNAWITWHNGPGVWQNGILRTGYISVVNYPPTGVRFTFTFNATATVYFAEFGMWHKNYIPGRHHFPELSFANKFTNQNRFVGTLVVDSANTGNVTGSTQLLVGSELQASAASIAQINGNLRVGSLTSHGVIGANTTNAVDIGTSAVRFRTVYAHTVDAATAVTVGGSTLATQSWVSGAYLPVAGGTMTGNLSLSYANPRLLFYDSASNVNSRRFDMAVSANKFTLKAYNDDFSYGNAAISVIQLGGGIASIDLTATSVLANGSDIATQAWVNGLGFATQSWVTSQAYATQSWVTSQSYATQAWVNGLNLATQAWVTAGFSPTGHGHTRSAISDFAHASSHYAGGSDAISWTTIHARGTSAGRPAASSSNAGYLYSNTTTGTLQLSDGSSWNDIAVSSSGAGTVSSVSLTAPSELFSVSGSPVTTTGTLGLTFASKAANLVFASPNAASGLPTFRSLGAGDIPSLPYLSTSGGTVNGDTTFSAATILRAAATASAATHVPVFTSSPSGSAVTMVSRTVSQLRADIGADNASNLISGTVGSDRINGSYTGITSVGTLSSLTSGGAITFNGIDASVNGIIGHVICKNATTHSLFPATNSYFKNWLAIAQSDVSGLVTALAGKVAEPISDGDWVRRKVGSTYSWQLALVEPTVNGLHARRVNGIYYSWETFNPFVEPTSDGYWVRRKNGSTYSWETVSSVTEPSSDGLYGRRKSGSTYSWESIPDLPDAPTADGPYVLVCVSGALSWRKLVGDGVNIT